MMSKLGFLMLIVLLVGMVPAAVLADVRCPQCYEPSYGISTVDGDVGEWDLEADFFAPLYRAGLSYKPVEGNLYLRYDCDLSLLYVLVLSVDSRPVADAMEEAWLKFSGSSSVVAPTAFSWVEKNGVVIGWEASYAVEGGMDYIFYVHTNVFNGEWQTAKTLELCITIDCPPTAVTLVSFTAEIVGKAVLLQWETAAEFETLGFNLYRSEAALDGARVKVNQSLIPAAAPGSLFGAQYDYTDNGVVSGKQYWYWLEEVGLSGASDMFGPAGPVFVGKTLSPRPRPSFPTYPVPYLPLVPVIRPVDSGR